MKAHRLVIVAAALTMVVAAALASALTVFIGQALPRAVRHDLSAAGGTALVITGSVLAAAAVIALAPITAPAALVALGVGAAAGAVGFGLNEALNQDKFCPWCIFWATVKGAAVGALAVLPFLAGPASLFGLAIAGLGSGAINYTSNYVLSNVMAKFGLSKPMEWKTSELLATMGLCAVGAVAGGIIVGGKVPPSGLPAYAMTPEGFPMPVPQAVPVATTATSAGAAAGTVALSQAATSGGGGGGADAAAKKQHEKELEEKSAKGDKDATYELNKIKAQKARDAGEEESARGYEYENKVVDEKGTDVVKAGEKVEYTNSKGEKVATDIDYETKNTVGQSKSGQKMPSPNQAEATRMHAQQTGKTPEVTYDPDKAPPNAVKEFKKNNPDFNLVPKKF